MDNDEDSYEYSDRVIDYARKLLKQDPGYIDHLKRQKEKESNLTARRVLGILSGSNVISPSRVNQTLSWDVLQLNTESGLANINGKQHRFNLKKTPFRIFKVLLEIKIADPNDGEVSYQKLKKMSGLKKTEDIKQKIRETRRQLGINSNTDPSADIFQPTGNGYRLIAPRITVS